MSVIYFLRHGQAGTRDNYDSLSDLGKEQASLLGKHLAETGLRPRALYTGELRRQRETAICVGEALGLMGQEIMPEWNEFDLDAVYEGIAPQLARDDEQFRGHWGELQETLAAANDAGIHRRWTKADTSVVRAWVAGRYTYSGESWDSFCRRVNQGLHKLKSWGEDDAILVSTSATPAAICIGLALELGSRHVMRLAGVTMNASYSALRVRKDDLAVMAFNVTAHLSEPRLRTHR